MTKKKILFIAPRFHTNQFFLTKQLIEKNNEVNFLSVYIGGSENHKFITPILSRPSILVKRLLSNLNDKNQRDRGLLRKYHLTSLKQCYKIYKVLNPDIVILRNLNYLFAVQHFLISILLRKRLYLYTQHKYKDRIRNSRKLFFKFLKILGVKHFTPVYGEENQPAIPNTTYIPFIIDKLSNDMDITLRSKNDGIRIITIGKMEERKKILELLKALKRINSFNSSNNELLIISECISDDNFLYLEKLKKELPSNSFKVSLHLNIDHKKVFTLLQQSDLFILPSYDEQAAFSILEAMASGLAVICSDSNGTKCYIEENVNGSVFKYTENLEFLDISLKNLLSKNKLHLYGLQSLKMIEKNHGIDAFYDYLLSQ